MLINKEGTGMDVWIFLGRRNRRDLLGGSGAAGHGNIMNQVGIDKKIAERDNWKGCTFQGREET